MTMMLDSTHDFLQKMNEFTPQTEQVTVSFDDISLFTNVALAKTIELIASYVYAEDNPIHTYRLTRTFL